MGRETSSKVGDLTREIEYLGVSGKRTTTLPETLNYKYNGTTLLETEYAYDTRGNISQMTVDGVTYTYTYDSLNQLTGVTGTNGYSASYTYNVGGNITSKTVGNDHFTYGYTDTNWKDMLTSYNGQAISYDGMGNPTVSYNKQFMWTGRQLTLAETIDGTLVGYSYNADGIRTQKDVCDVVTEYFLQGSTILAEKTGSNVIWYIYDTGGELLGFTYNGTPYYYLKNMQGDVYKVVDANGTVVASYTYDPWGKVLTATGTMAQINPIRYRSYYYDSETQLYYLQSRYYDPELGRFINADTLVATGQGLIGNNMFAYCLNNPIIYIDETGQSTEALRWWTANMWWLTLVDLYNAIGDAIYVGGIAVLGTITLVATIFGGITYSIKRAKNKKNKSTTSDSNQTDNKNTSMPSSSGENSLPYDNNYHGGTTYNKNGVRVDYEYYGNGTGNVHIHTPQGKFYFDSRGYFRTDVSSLAPLAPKIIQDLLHDKGVFVGIQKALRYINELGGIS